MIKMKRHESRTLSICRSVLGFHRNPFSQQVIKTLLTSSVCTKENQNYINRFLLWAFSSSCLKAKEVCG